MGQLGTFDLGKRKGGAGEGGKLCQCMSNFPNVNRFVAATIFTAYNNHENCRTCPQTMYFSFYIDTYNFICNILMEIGAHYLNDRSSRRWYLDCMNLGMDFWGYY